MRASELGVEFRSMRARIETLEAHVNTLYSNVNDLYHKRDGQSIASNRPSIAPDGSLSADKAHVAHSSPHSSSLRSESQQPPLKRPRFHGPTSNAFNFDVARSSLQTMGITNPTDENIRPPEDDQTNTQLPSFPQLLSHPSKDPLWTIGRPEVLRIMQAYAEQVHVMYPILDMKKAYNHANLLFNFIEAADRTGLAMRSLPGADGLYDDDTCILKLLLAASLLAEKNGESEMAGNLFSSVKDKVMEKIFEPADLKSLQLLFLTVRIPYCHAILFKPWLMTTSQFTTSSSTKT
ncbi:hypothetical protein KEM55_001655 [Ascosphaera atra]|nr:hypothetical protein KEM55_001655 [Ascosphaera atra]